MSPTTWLESSTQQHLADQTSHKATHSVKIIILNSSLNTFNFIWYSHPPVCLPTKQTKIHLVIIQRSCLAPFSIPLTDFSIYNGIPTFTLTSLSRWQHQFFSFKRTPSTNCIYWTSSVEMHPRWLWVVESGVNQNLAQDGSFK